MRKTFLDSVAAICLITAGTVVGAKVFAPWGIVKFFIVGGVTTALIRSLRHGEYGTLEVLLNDYRLDKYATLSLLRLAFTLCQGVAFGASTGFFIEGMIMLTVGKSNPYFYIPLVAGTIAPLIAFIFIRVVLECLSLLFKAADNFTIMMQREK